MFDRTALIALLVVLAGCQFVGTTGGDPTPTATPAPVPTVATEATGTAGTPDRFDLPPGVSRRGVTDIATLALAHYRAVVGTSYVWSDRHYSETGANTSAITAVRRRVRLVTGTRYSLLLSERRLPGSAFRPTRRGIDRFADGEQRYSRYRARDAGSDPAYTSIPAWNKSARFANMAAASIGLYLDLPDATVSVVTVDGQRYYEITAHRDVYTSASLTSREVLSARNYTARAVVSPDGFVTRLNVSYTATGNDSDSPIAHSPGDRVHYSFAYRQVGTATVEPPDWLDEARESFARERGLADDDTTVIPDPRTTTPRTPNGTTVPGSGG